MSKFSLVVAFFMFFSSVALAAQSPGVANKVYVLVPGEAPGEVLLNDRSPFIPQQGYTKSSKSHFIGEERNKPHLDCDVSYSVIFYEQEMRCTPRNIGKMEPKTFSSNVRNWGEVLDFMAQVARQAKNPAQLSLGD
jgi:hypothetical protein